MTLRISGLSSKNGTNSAQAEAHSPLMAGYLFAPGVVELAEPGLGVGLVRRGVDGWRSLAVRSQSTRLARRRVLRMRCSHLGLHDRQRPGGLDRVGEALEPVAADDADVFDATVLDLSQHLEPVLGALAASPGPQPGDVALGVDGDTDRRVDRPARDITIGSTSPRRRWRLRTIFSSKDPSRSRGTSTSTRPTSVSTVLVRVPLRELLPSPPAGSCSAQPRWSSISVAVPLRGPSW